MSEASRGIAPVLLVSHGAATLTTRAGGPSDVALREAARWLEGSRALIVLSAHDVREEVTVGVAPTISMWRDHPAADGLAWQTRGDADLATSVRARLAEAGIAHRRGAPRLDHGAWVPLRALDPAGARPLVTLSLHAGFDPAFHEALGAALRPLRADGVAVLCSGGITHDQSEFRRGYFAREAPATAVASSARFEAWALAAFVSPEPARSELLRDAERHPDFRECHPTLDHWLPSRVALGAAGEDHGLVLHRGFQHSLSTAMVGFGLTARDPSVGP